MAKAAKSEAVRENADIRDLVDAINADSTQRLAYTADEMLLSDVKGFLSTGCTNVDLILGGGVPIGRVVEIFGMESSGKSTILTNLFINCQRLGVSTYGQPGLCVLVDYETTFSKHRGVRMGLDPKYLIELPADTIEEGFDLVLNVVQKAKEKVEWQDRPIIVAFDTIAAAPTAMEKEGEKKEAMASKAKIIQAGFRKVGRDFGRHSITFVVVNQMIADPSPYGANLRTPGGNAPRFYSTQRFQCFKQEKITSGSKILGHEHKVRVIKNKVDGLWIPTVNEATYFSHFYDGIQDGISMLHWLVEEKRKGFAHDKGRYKFSFDGKDYNFFYRDAEPTIRNTPGMYDWLKSEVTDQFTLYDLQGGASPHVGQEDDQSTEEAE